MTSNNNMRVHLRIQGRVQGVYFRANTAQQASALALTGWVRNLPDGSVEAVAEGPRHLCEQLVEWSRRGPPAAAVTHVAADWSPATGEFADFRVRYRATSS